MSPDPFFRGRSIARIAFRRAGARGTRKSASRECSADLRRRTDRSRDVIVCMCGRRVSARHHRPRRWASRACRVARFFVVLVLGRTHARADGACRARRGKRGSCHADRRRDGGHRARRRARMRRPESSIGAAIEAVRLGRTVFVLGIGKSEMTFPLMRMSTREVDVRFQYRYTWLREIRLVEVGVLSDVRKLVTHRFPIPDPKSGAIRNSSRITVYTLGWIGLGSATAVKAEAF